MNQDLSGMTPKELAAYCIELVSSEYGQIKSVLGNSIYTAAVVGSVGAGKPSHEKLWPYHMIAGIRTPDGRVNYLPPFYWRVLGYSDIDLMIIYEGDAENVVYEMKNDIDSRRTDRMMRTIAGQQSLVPPLMEASFFSIDNISSYIRVTGNYKDSMNNVSEAGARELLLRRLLTEQLFHIGSLATSNVEDVYFLSGETNGRQLKNDLSGLFLRSEIAMLEGQREGAQEYLSILMETARKVNSEYPFITIDFPFAYKSFQRRRGLEAASKIDDFGGRIFSQMVGLYREIEADMSVTELAAEMGMKTEDINPQQRFHQALSQIPTTEQFVDHIGRVKVKYTPEEVQNYIAKRIDAIS